MWMKDALPGCDLHAVVCLQDGVLGGEEQGPALIQRVLKAGLREASHALIGVEPASSGGGEIGRVGVECSYLATLSSVSNLRLAELRGAASA